VSQVVLRRFCKDGLLAVTHLPTGDQAFKPPDEVGFVEIPKVVIGRLEQIWGNGVENAAKAALNALEHGDLLQKPKHVATIKDLIALHFVRSWVLIEIVDEGKIQTSKELWDRLSQRFPDRRADTERVAEDVLNRILVEVLEENIDKVKRFFAPMNLEIGMSGISDRMILGDVPVMNLSADGRLGIKGGVPINESTAVGMPLTPNHLVSLTSEAAKYGYVALSPAETTAVSEKQRALAARQLFALPLG